MTVSVNEHNHKENIGLGNVIKEQMGISNCVCVCVCVCVYCKKNLKN